MIIVIDGPAGSGKSSTARAVAGKLGIEYLDSGALYRALTTVYVDQEGDDLNLFFEILGTLTISFKYEDGLFRVWVDQQEVTDRLRSKEIAEHVSEVASMPRVRSFVNELMRNAVQTGNYIAEGRDLGTAVFPEADLKFFMSASVEERARRRLEQLQEKDIDTTLEQVHRNIRQRDQKDTQRTSDPLKKADDAIEVDTTNLTFEQQVEQICSTITQKLN